jgi:DNA-binding NtrC family response regulator
MVAIDRRKSVLIVEDDVLAANLIERLLRSVRSDMDFDWTNSAEDAIRTISLSHQANLDCPYDLIVSDFYLEGSKMGLDFWNVCREFYPTVPFVLMSGNDLSDFLEQEEDGALPYFLKKPFDIKKARVFFQRFLKNGNQNHAQQN